MLFYFHFALNFYLCKTIIMNRITYSLNYRKPKDQYKDNDELTVCLRYFHKNNINGKGKIIKKTENRRYQKNFNESHKNSTFTRTVHL